MLYLNIEYTKEMEKAEEMNLKKRIISFLVVLAMLTTLCVYQIELIVPEETEESREIKVIQTVEEEDEQDENSDVENIPETYLIEKFPIVYQMPELPTGCEITALTMVLNYYGCPADKVIMATKYLPMIEEDEIHREEDGTIHGPDLKNYFIGDPTTEMGIVCGTGAIVTAANDYLEDIDSKLRAKDKTGAEPEELYRFVSQGVPVVVWCTISMEDRIAEDGWYTEEGEYVDWANVDHGAVLIGYTNDTVTIADPISGEVEYSKAQFESVFRSRNNQCVILL